MTPALAEATGAVGLPVDLLRRVQPSIVRVQDRGAAGAGGVVWRPGAVVTNRHVVAGAGRALHVVSADGRPHATRILDTSRQLDLALLAVDPGDLRPAPLGRSAGLRVGELVFAIGHPWGQPWVVTAGIVSALDGPPGPDPVGRVRAIRSDVRLAPGNSGGPLLDVHGDVIGLNAMVIGGDLALAIPVDVVRRWLDRAR
ncbi:MAG TPA: trypsin-like peptidase domain-containing protein [Methylomirabilota bacterium]|nr:trypsin-like peptidase domain-containing protein [Methylomirabilota bacterium]